MESRVHFPALEYRNSMAQDGRILIMSENGKEFLVMFISITDDWLPYEDKELYEYKPHDPKGKFCFVEQMVATKWNKEIRNQVESFITDRYPFVQYGIWYRPGQDEDRLITYKRRNYVQHKVSRK